MEAVSYLAGEEFGDHPRSAPRVPAAFLRRWNDDLDDAARQMLKPYVPRLVAGADPELEEAHVWLASDWLVRELAPAFLRLAGLENRATELETLPALGDSAGAESAGPIIGEARDAATEAAAGIRVTPRGQPDDPSGAAVLAASWAFAWDATRAAGWAAAGSAMWAPVDEKAVDPAWTVAGDAARLAAWDAVRVAAWNAASVAAAAAADDPEGDAAWTAARDAVRVALRPTVELVQQLALRLLDRMLEPRPVDR